MKTKTTKKMKTATANQSQHVIIRATHAGAFFGHLKSKTGDEVTLINARRIWQWAGAATLSQLAMEGTKQPQDCKFPQPVDEITVLGVIEIIPTTAEAEANLNAVPVWKQ